MTRTVRLFLDFDGTMTAGDVGNAFFERFGGPVCRDVVGQYRSGAISARACFEEEMRAVGTVQEDAITAFLAEQHLDPGTADLLAFCSGRGIPVTILSDGLDAYIRPLLRAHGIDAVPFFANHVSWVPASGGVTGRLAFPHANAECDRCACCKRNLMLGSGADGDVLVYAGDGYSDRCPVAYADIVFAKGALQTWCQENNITYLTYHSLADVRRRLETELGRRTVRPRPAAERKRREAYMMEA